MNAVGAASEVEDLASGCARVQMHTHVHVQTHRMPVHTCASPRTLTQLLSAATHTRAHTWPHSGAHVRKPPHTHTAALCSHTRMDIHGHTLVHTCASTHTLTQLLSAATHTHGHTWPHTGAHVCKHPHTHTAALCSHTHACTHIHMPLNTCASTRTLTHT